MYGVAFPMSDQALSDSFVIPFGQAKIEREGQNVTLVGYSKGVQLCLESAQELEKLGISAEVIFFFTKKCFQKSFVTSLFLKIVMLTSLKLACRSLIYALSDRSISKLSKIALQKLITSLPSNKVGRFAALVPKFAHKLWNRKRSTNWTVRLCVLPAPTCPCLTRDS